MAGTGDNELVVRVGRGEYKRLPVEVDQLGDCLMPVLGWTGVELRWIGTAFAVAPFGLLLTAKHVVDEFLDNYGHGLDDGSTALIALWETTRRLPAREPGVPAFLGGPLTVRRISSHPTADVALLQVELPVLTQRVELPVLAIDVTPMEPGDECVAIGYAHTLINGRVVAGTPSAVDYQRQLAASRGTVLEVHLTRHDRVMWNFPCVVTDARYNGGMSGSPVVGEDGRVRGLVSSSTDAETPAGEPFTSHVAFLADALALHVIVRIDGVETDVTLFELATSGFASIDGLDSFDVVEDDSDEGDLVEWLRSSSPGGTDKGSRWRIRYNEPPSRHSS